MQPISLQTRYRSANENTIALWAKNAGIGNIREENYYDPVKLALAAGIKPSVSLPVLRLLDELQRLTQADPLADTLPVQGLHFTFLPLTLPLYNVNEPLPAKAAQLTTIWKEFAAKKSLSGICAWWHCLASYCLRAYLTRLRLPCASHSVKRFWIQTGKMNC